MNCKLLTGMVVLGIVLSMQTVPEKGWQDIVPLHSTRKDVERLLGPPQEFRGVAATFQLKDGRVRVFYSDGYCRRLGTNDWNVPPDTVVSLTFQPSSELMIAELKLDMTKYEREADPHLPRAVHYYNREAGIRISTRLETEGEDVQSIIYEPTEKDLHLRCSNNSQAFEKLSTGTQSIPVFQRYGPISRDVEKAILDNFAVQLLNGEEITGYVVLRRGGYSSKVAAKKLRYIRNYLSKYRGVPVGRVSAFEGKPQRDFSVELYLVTKGKPGPT